MLEVEMLSTGDEVLHGQIVDTNAVQLADSSFHQGLPPSRRGVVGDNLDDLVIILRECSQHADMLIVDDGLGPTSDDLSTLAAAATRGRGPVLHGAWLEEVERYFHERGRVMVPSGRKQAGLPASAEFINNSVGTACGFAIQLNRCLMFFAPGVPSEFKMMVEHGILPHLRGRLSLPQSPVCLRLVTLGRSEDDLIQNLDTLQLPSGVTMDYYSSMPTVKLRLAGSAGEEQAMEELWLDIKCVAGRGVIFRGTEGPPAQINRELQSRQFNLTLNKQFTGGLLAL